MLPPQRILRRTDRHLQSSVTASGTTSLRRGSSPRDAPPCTGVLACKLRTRQSPSTEKAGSQCGTGSLGRLAGRGPGAVHGKNTHKNPYAQKWRATDAQYIGVSRYQFRHLTPFPASPAVVARCTLRAPHAASITPGVRRTCPPTGITSHR